MARTGSAAEKHRIVKRQIIAGHSRNRKAFLEAADPVRRKRSIARALSTKAAVVCSSCRWRGSSGGGTPLLAYYAAPLKPSGPEEGALGPLS